MADVISMNVARADREHDNTLLTARECLQRAIQAIDEGTISPNRILVLHLNDAEGYECGFFASNLKASEMIALSEISKATFLAEMGFGSGD